jgi:RNA polymerase sigma-70 factor, ECF subfamily
MAPRPHLARQADLPDDDGACAEVGLRSDREIITNTPPSSPVLAADEDATLVARLRDGEDAAFEALIRAHYRTAYAVALGVTGRPADAEDVCQDAWVRVLERIGELREPARFRAWMLQIVRHSALNHLARLRVRRAESLEAAEAQRRGDPRQDLVVVFLRARLERALAGISEVQREIVLLHDLDGWGHRAIAEQLGVSEVMSRQHLFQARRQLRRLLTGKDGRHEP